MSAEIIAKAKQKDYLERFSRIATLITFGITVLVAFAAPLLAISWSRRPFPGFLVEQTLVVNNISGEGWAGAEAGIAFPQQVLRVGGVEVQTSSNFDAVLVRHEVGDQIAVMTRQQDGSIRLYPNIVLDRFPARALLRHFWVLYMIGIVYLGIGIWVYLVRGKSRTGRALAFFCATTSLGTMLIFDLSSTHLLVPLWISAVALAAGSLVSLGMRFPVEWHIVRILPWVLVVPYGFSIALSIWGLFSAYSLQNPWSYIDNWETTYRFAAISILLFLGMVLYHALSPSSYRVRQQARIVMLGSAIAFIPVAIMFTASRRIGFHVFLLVFLPAFPISVAVAVMRYNLWKVDKLVNRAIVYAALTTLLAGLFTALGEILEMIFIFTFGETSDATIVITAFIVAATVKPVQGVIDRFVNTRMGVTHDKTRPLKEYGEEVRNFLFFNDPDQVTLRLLEEIAVSLNAESCAVVIQDQGRYEVSHVFGPWRGKALASVPLIWQENRFGTLFIGPHAAGLPYTPEDFKTVQQVTAQVARAIHLYTRMDPAPENKAAMPPGKAPQPLPGGNHRRPSGG